MPASHRTRLLVIGSGPAGYAAAIYAARANIEPIVVHGLQPGGQLTITTDIENYPGAFPFPSGPALMETMREQAEHCGARMIHDLITKIDLAGSVNRFRGDSGDEYVADAVVIATGAQARWLGNEPASLVGRGISACATCDGFFFRRKEVAVIGGGNTAVEEALFLAGLASKVTLVHRRDSLRAEPILRDRLLAHPRVEVAWNSTVEEFLGGERGLTALRLRGADGSAATLPVDGAFVAIGHDPASKVFRGHVPMDGEGYILVEPGTSRVPGLPSVFAAGDVTDKVYRQAVTAAGMGCMAALDARRLLEERGLA